jgi:hypothetical protein
MKQLGQTQFTDMSQSLFIAKEKHPPVFPHRRARRFSNLIVGIVNLV